MFQLGLNMEAEGTVCIAQGWKAFKKSRRCSVNSKDIGNQLKLALIPHSITQLCDFENVI
jgi:hypothetical protein